MAWHKSQVRDLLLCGFFGAWTLAGNKKPETRPLKLGLYCHKTRADIKAGDYTLDEWMVKEDDEEARNILETTFLNDPHLTEHEGVLLEQYLQVDELGSLLGFCEEVPDGFIAGTLDEIYLPLKYGWRRGLLIVDDYKTGWIESQFRPEIVFYLLLAWAYCKASDIPVERARFTYFYGRSGRRVSINYERSFEELLIEAKMIVRQCEIILENPIPVPGNHCAFCPLIHTECPLYSALPAASSDPKIGQLLDTFMASGELKREQAPAVGLALQALDSKVAELKGRFREWVRENGPVSVGEKQWQIREQDGDSWDQEISWEILKDASDEEKRIALGVDTRRLKRLRKHNKELANRLYRYARIGGKPKEVFALTK